MATSVSIPAGPSSFAAIVRSAMAPVLVIGLALFLQLVVKQHVGDYASKIILDIGTNLILAVSLTMVNGFTGQFSMGHAAFMLVGGYVAAMTVYYGSMHAYGDAEMHGGRLSSMSTTIDAASPWLTRGDGLFVGSILLGGLFAAGAGYIVGLPSLRLKGDYLAIVTLGFGEIMRVLVQAQTKDVLYTPEDVLATPTFGLAQLFKNPIENWGHFFQDGFSPEKTDWVSPVWLHVGGALGFSGLPFYSNLFWVYIFAGLTILVAFRLKRSTYGRAFLSIREDEIASEAMGVNTTRYKVRAFVISAFFAGVAGGLFAHTVGVQLNPGELGFMKSFDIIIMVVLGGLGSISGAVIAAIILTILPELLRDIAQYRMIVYALLLILMMLLRPQGLLGVREIWDRQLWRGRSGGRSPGGKGANK